MVMAGIHAVNEVGMDLGGTMIGCGQIASAGALVRLGVRHGRRVTRVVAATVTGRVVLAGGSASIAATVVTAAVGATRQQACIASAGIGFAVWHRVLYLRVT